MSLANTSNISQEEMLKGAKPRNKVGKRRLPGWQLGHFLVNDWRNLTFFSSRTFRDLRGAGQPIPCSYPKELPMPKLSFISSPRHPSIAQRKVGRRAQDHPLLLSALGLASGMGHLFKLYKD